MRQPGETSGLDQMATSASKQTGVCSGMSLTMRVHVMNMRMTSNQLELLAAS